MNYLIISLALAGSAVAAAPDTPALYSHAIPVQVRNKGSLVQLRLPKDIYLNARSANLDDVRVFDSQGRSVPFALTLPAAPAGVPHRTTPAKVFALTAEAVASAGALSIQTRPDGTLLSVESRGGAPATGATLAGLLIDLGLPATARPKVDALVFTAPPGVDNYSARVMIEASDDLQDWVDVAEGRLDWLSNSASDTLANNRIAFNLRSMRYARLRWIEGTPRMFGTVLAERAEADAAPAVTDTLLVAAQPGVFAGDLVYPVGRAVPLRSIGMQLLEPGMVVPSQIGRYVELPAVAGAAVPRATNRWQFVPLLRTTFYNMLQNGAVRASADVTIAPLSVDRLVVRPATPLASPPLLRIGWLPATLVFAAREAGPYTLAVGREQAIGAERPLAEVAPGYQAQELLALENAVAGPVVVQHLAADDPSQAARAGMSATARTAVLWGALLLGVLVLALLSWRMLRAPAVNASDTPDADGPAL